MWSYNTRTLQGFTTDVNGQYAWLFALCMDQGFGTRQFVDLFGTTEPDLQLETAFVREFGQRYARPSSGIRGEQCCTCWKGECFDTVNSGGGRKEWHADQ